MRSVLGFSLRSLGGLAFFAFGVYAQQGRQGGPPAPVPPVLRDYQAVSEERLKNPEASNWLMIRRTYDGWGYSPLDQLTPAAGGHLEAVSYSGMSVSHFLNHF